MNNQYYFCLYRTNDPADAANLVAALTTADIINEPLKAYTNGQLTTDHVSVRFAFKTSEEPTLIAALKNSGHYDWFKGAYPRFIEGTY